MSRIAASATNSANSDENGLIPADTVYKIVSTEVWIDAVTSGIFQGAAIDITDGYIHFSTADQVQSTLQKHFSGQSNLTLVAVDAQLLVGQIVYEKAREGELFLHLYSPLDMGSVIWSKPLPLGNDDQHEIPELGRH